MIIVNLKDGLGNQMFQYALGYALAKRNNSILGCDTRCLEEFKKNPPKNYIIRDFDLDIFGIKKRKIPFIYLLKCFQFNKRYVIRFNVGLFLDKLNYITIIERQRSFDYRVFDRIEKTLYLDGYWQSEKYFTQYRDEILKIFNFDSLIKKNENIDFLDKTKNEISVCLNVRRTDHLNNIELDVVHLSYYKNAMSYYRNINENKVNFFVFSDDLNWCKKNFYGEENCFFVEHNPYAGYKYYNYLYLMSNFENFIIPNSTFAWWGAWLSTKKNKKIVAPKKWSGINKEYQMDTVPDNWVRIDN
tara:strand:+ start:368 stop:1270 length:903 start_codon:yes stop_codon:yes gene_type:complete